MENKQIAYTQPELGATMSGGIVAMNSVLINAFHRDPANRHVLYGVYVLGLLLFIFAGVYMARKRSILELEEDRLRARNKFWRAEQLKAIVWNHKARRIMLKPKTGFGLGLTLAKDNVDSDSKLIMDWAQAYGVPIDYK